MFIGQISTSSTLDAATGGVTMTYTSSQVASSDVIMTISHTIVIPAGTSSTSFTINGVSTLGIPLTTTSNDVAFDGVLPSPP